MEHEHVRNTCTAPWQVIAALLVGGVASEPAPFLNQPRHTSRTYGARAPRQIRHPVISRAHELLRSPCRCALQQPPKRDVHDAWIVPCRPTTPGVFQHHSLRGDSSGASRCRGALQVRVRHSGQRGSRFAFATLLAALHLDDRARPLGCSLRRARGLALSSR